MYLVVTVSTYSSSYSSFCLMPSESCLQIIIIMRYLLLWFTSVNNYARLYIKSNPHLTYRPIHRLLSSSSSSCCCCCCSFCTLLLLLLKPADLVGAGICLLFVVVLVVILVKGVRVCVLWSCVCVLLWCVRCVYVKKVLLLLLLFVCFDICSFRAKGIWASSVF